MANWIKKQSIFKRIPIIDIAPLVIPNDNSKLIQKTGDEIRDACKNVGFFYIKNHQIPQSHLDSVIPSIQHFFNLSLHEKMKIHISKSDNFRGYTPLGKELTNNKYDWHECVDFGLDLKPNDPEVISGKQLAGPNQWPENQRNFKKTLEKHWNLMIILGRMITQGLAISLGLSKNYFAPFMNKSHSYMRITNYPPYENNQKENIGDGIGSHIDYGFLTILLQDNIGGLEIKNSNNEWFSAPIIPGTFLINIGHMIQRWTNDYYRATIHRVTPPQNKTRCSLPFFFEPDFDTVVAPLEKFCSKDNLPKYKPIHFGDYLERTFKTSYSSIIQ
jgi:isopenicillin N synthase-like dioxygenase